jgi:hypothetical protein
MVIGFASAGALGTILTGGQPGVLLGVFLLAGTLAAGLAVRQNATHLVIPVPALAYPLAALAAGFAGNPGGSSKAALAIGAVQWVAHGFLPMLAATVVAVGIAVARGRRTEPSPARSRGQRPARPAAGSRDGSRPESTSPFDSPSPTGRGQRDRRHSEQRRRY